MIENVLMIGEYEALIDLKLAGKSLNTLRGLLIFFFFPTILKLNTFFSLQIFQSGCDFALNLCCLFLVLLCRSTGVEQ